MCAGIGDSSEKLVPAQGHEFLFADNPQRMNSGSEHRFAVVAGSSGNAFTGRWKMRKEQEQQFSSIRRIASILRLSGIGHEGAKIEAGVPEFYFGLDAKEKVGENVPLFTRKPPPRSGIRNRDDWEMPSSCH